MPSQEGLWMNQASQSEEAGSLPVRKLREEDGEREAVLQRRGTWGFPAPMPPPSESKGLEGSRTAAPPDQSGFISKQSSAGPAPPGRGRWAQ